LFAATRELFRGGAKVYFLENEKLLNFTDSFNIFRLHNLFDTGKDGLPPVSSCALLAQVAE
jgi:hypothetical protein